MSDFNDKYNKAYSDSRKNGKRYLDKLMEVMGADKPIPEDDEEDDKKKPKFRRLQDSLNKDE